MNLIDDQADVQRFGGRRRRLFIGAEPIEAILVKLCDGGCAETLIVNGKIIEPAVEVAIVAAGVIANAPVTIGGDGLGRDGFW